MGSYTLKVSFKNNAIKGIDIKHLESERYMSLDNYLNTRPDNEITDLKDNISNTVTNPDSTTLLITSNDTGNNVADITTNTSSSVTNVAPSPDPSSTIITNQVINQNTGILQRIKMQKKANATELPKTLGNIPTTNLDYPRKNMIVDIHAILDSLNYSQNCPDIYISDSYKVVDLAILGAN